VLRPAAYADRDLILPWRNHPSVRAVSLTTHEIKPEEHARWWEKRWRDVLIYEDDRGARPGDGAAHRTAVAPAAKIGHESPGEPDGAEKDALEGGPPRLVRRGRDGTCR